MPSPTKSGGGHAARAAQRAAQRAAPPAPDPVPPSRARARAPSQAALPLRVEVWPLSRLVQYERNPRKNDEHVGRMADAIREFGFRIPIVAKSDGTIVDGHLRYKAARKLRLAEVPVALADGLTDAQIQAFRLLANKSANWATFDDELLLLELGELRDVGFNLEMTGFDLGELATLFGEDEPDAAAEPAEPIAVKVCCPECGHEFPAEAKGLRRKAAA